MKKSFVYYIALSLFLVACSNSETPSTETDAYAQSVKDWRQKRVDNLTSGSSWLSLAGLYRLKEGENSFGSGDENSLKFPAKAASNMGSFMVNEDSVFISVAEGVEITLNQSPVKKASMQADTSGSTPIFHYQSLNWNLIQRGDQFLVRLRDTLNEAIGQFSHIDYFDINPAWNIEAKYVLFDTIKMKTYQNVLGIALDLAIEGRLEFEKNGQNYTLEVLDGGPDDFFIIFEDETTGDSTYGGGRYIYVPRPKEGNTTFIDFNKAYNPPCAFTAYATCLLPTPENKLALSIPAGEKNYGDH